MFWIVNTLDFTPCFPVFFDLQKTRGQKGLMILVGLQNGRKQAGCSYTLNKIASISGLKSLSIEKETFSSILFSWPTNRKMHTCQAVIFLCKNKIDPSQLREL